MSIADVNNFLCHRRPMIRNKLHMTANNKKQQKFIFPIKKSPVGERLFSVDPTGFAPVSLLVKGRILLHKLQARIHDYNFNINNGNKKSPLSRTSSVTSSKPVIYTNPTFATIITKLKSMSIANVNNFLREFMPSATNKNTLTYD